MKYKEKSIPQGCFHQSLRHSVGVRRDRVRGRLHGRAGTAFHDLLLSVRHPRLARISLRSDAGRCNLRPNHTQLAHHHHQGRFHEEAQRGHRLSIGRAARNPSGRPAQFWWPGRASEAERLPHHPHGEDAPSPRNACTTISGLTAPARRNIHLSRGMARKA